MEYIYILVPNTLLIYFIINRKIANSIISIEISINIMFFLFKFNITNSIFFYKFTIRLWFKDAHLKIHRASLSLCAIPLFALIPR